jgi:glutathione S-transferase
MAIIFGVPASPFVRKAILAHAYKGIPFELKPVMPGSDDAEFRASSPFGKVPGYCSDDGCKFADSSVIVAYLERTQTDKQLYPQDNSHYATALYLEEFADTKFMEATAALYFQRILGPKFFGKPTEASRVEQILNELLPPVLDYAESKLSSTWYCGDTFSIADLAIGVNLINLYHGDFSIDASRWPKLAAFNTRFLGLDFVKKQLATEQQMFASAA